MVSGKNIPYSSEIEGVKATCSVEVMTSEKEKPSVFEIEDVGLTSLPPVDIASSTTSEESKSPDFDSPPDGGLFAWMQVLGGWILVLNSRGMTNTFGAFQTYYTHHLLTETSPSAISWIGSIQTFTLMFVGVLSGRLLDAGYLRTQLCAGIFLEFLGMVLTAASTKYWHVLVSQGICVGLGAGLLYLPSVAVPAQYFSSNVMLATGIVATGSSMAGVVYPILIRDLLPQVNFAWTIRCLAVVVLVTNCASLALMHPRLKPATVKPFTINIYIFLDSPYVLFVLAMTFLFASVYIPYFYLEEYAKSQIMDQQLVEYLLSIMNAASFFGRILPGWLADWHMMNKLMVVSTTCLLSGVTVLLWLTVRSKGGIVAFAIIYGFISGGLVSLPPATVAGLSNNQDEYSTLMGMAFTICSFGALVGNPIAGVLLDTVPEAEGKKRFLGPWLFAGGTMISAAALTLVAYYLYNRNERRGSSDRCGSPNRPRKSKWLRSLANEALTMQGAAFAL